MLSIRKATPFYPPPPRPIPQHQPVLSFQVASSCPNLEGNREGFGYLGPEFCAQEGVGGPT